ETVRAGQIGDPAEAGPGRDSAAHRAIDGRDERQLNRCSQNPGRGEGAITRLTVQRDRVLSESVWLIAVPDPQPFELWAQRRENHLLGDCSARQADGERQERQADQGREGDDCATYASAEQVPRGNERRSFYDVL